MPKCLSPVKEPLSSLERAIRATAEAASLSQGSCPGNGSESRPCKGTV